MNNLKNYKIIIYNQVNQRLDNYLIKSLKGIPNNLIYRLIRKGIIKINNKTVKAKNKLQIGDKIRIPILYNNIVKKQININETLKKFLINKIIYESNDWLIINKPSGFAVHGGSNINIGLIEALKLIIKDINLIELVHRIDKNTSGCLLIAKSIKFLLYINSAFKKQYIEKCYLALVEGNWPINYTYIYAPINKININGEYYNIVNKLGKPSYTFFEICKKFTVFTLIKVFPITGRMHQIRVHTAYLGHPCLGDEKYGSKFSKKFLKLKRMFLHSYYIRFPEVKSGKVIQIKTKIDEELKLVLTRANKYIKENIMAVQKNKKTRSKRGMRRSHNALVLPTLNKEKITGTIHRRHYISSDGYYRGKKIL
ncbi:50S ribosomal protein L32 [Candidatus Portiera aleyrodidarum]|uniref:Large ribosomal subunit protein bL32 n=1 Tax=Candidatus Portiera aleyrodidarum TaxID=91844 RepID=A0A6S6RY89_9GAMM|nr:50S ribosomal protein L32 [Candidatus Portiera aleyrodidarum]CAA3704984.1 Fused ribosomal large subunit pseudouridine synthase C and 50S ribosomal protein L32 [Candidatus Portiera aleyrodidarum]